MKNKFSYLLFLALELLSVPLYALTVQECVWFPTPSGPTKTTNYTPWVQVGSNSEYTTEERICCTIWTGPAEWYDKIITRLCIGTSGIAIGTSSPSGVVGFEYIESWTTSNHVFGPGVARRYVLQTRHVFNNSSASGINQNISETRYAHEGIVNQWVGATVTFDGNIVNYGDAINFSDVSLGTHQYVITKTVSTITDVFTFNITVVPSYWFEYLGDGSTVVPTRIVRFHNDSPDSITVDFSTSSTVLGVATNLGSNNVANLPSGGTVDLSLDLFTNPGYIIAPGQVPVGSILAKFGDANGDILAIYTSSPLMIPTLSEWSLIILLLLFAAFTMRFMYKRQTSLVVTGNLGEVKFIEPSLWDRKLFLRHLAITLGLTVVTLMITFWLSTTLTLIDTIGSIACTAIIAYMTHLHHLRNKDAP